MTRYSSSRASERRGRKRSNQIDERVPSSEGGKSRPWPYRGQCLYEYLGQLRVIATPKDYFPCSDDEMTIPVYYAHTRAILAVLCWYGSPSAKTVRTEGLLCRTYPYS
eukprot:scaffold209227_cov23-Prasinocladus_malaysianus.AAC.1